MIDGLYEALQDMAVIVSFLSYQMLLPQHHPFHPWKGENRMANRTMGEIISTLRREKGMTQKELADKLSITPAAVTGILKRLEAEQYIERTLGTDNRYNEISITDKGRAVVDHTRLTFGNADRALFEDFSDEELDVYVRCLEKMQANIRKQLPEERKKQ